MAKAKAKRVVILAVERKAARQLERAAEKLVGTVFSLIDDGLSARLVKVMDDQAEAVSNVIGVLEGIRYAEKAANPKS